MGICALVYLDDAIIFSNTFENHMIDIRSVFDLLKSANLKLKLKNCQFIRKTVNYLGHIISSAGISPDPQKIDSIVHYKTPTSAGEARSFLGLAGYYRRFVKDFGTIARPLTLKTHKDAVKQEFTWTADDQEAFETLRTAFGNCSNFSISWLWKRILITGAIWGNFVTNPEWQWSCDCLPQ